MLSTCETSILAENLPYIQNIHKLVVIFILRGINVIEIFFKYFFLY